MNIAELDILIEKVAAHDMDALESLYRETKDSVYAYALSVMKNVHDAEDVLQECYINIYRGASGYRSQGKPLAWILTVARNLCMKKFSETKNRVELTEEEWSEHLESFSELTPEEKTILKDCMSLLSEEERHIVTLHAVSGYKHREISEVLKIPLSTVLSKYNRALAKLNKM